MQLTQRHRDYWKKTLRLTTILLSIWFVVTFVMGWFAVDLATINFFGWPFAFYMGAQGSLIIYVILIYIYARKMHAYDIECGVDEGDE